MSDVSLLFTDIKIVVLNFRIAQHNHHIFLSQRNGEDFKKKLVSELMVEVKSSVKALLEVLQNSDGKVTDDLLTTGKVKVS